MKRFYEWLSEWLQARYTFEIKILPTLTVLCALAICVALGFWQLQRAEFKKQIQERYDERIVQMPLSLNELARLDPNDLDFYPVRVKGKFDNAHTVLLDNKIYKGQLGYEVITPLEPEASTGSKQLLLVSRGWVPRGRKREQLPKIEAVYDVKELFGYAKVPEAKAFRLGANVESGIESDKPIWPLRMQQLDKISMAQLADGLGRPVYPVILLLAPEQPGELQRIWQQPADTKAVKKHHGYAVQWFLLAGILGIFLVIVNVRKK
jgi:surfeit locus 1 family protein